MCDKNESNNNVSYVFCAYAKKKDGTIVRPKKAKALRIPLAKAKKTKS